MIKHDNCKDCRSKCEHAGKDREFVCIGGESCKKTAVTNFDRIKNMTVEEMASERIREYTADNEGGYTYFCGDYDERDYPSYYFTNLFIPKNRAKERAIQAEIKWLESEVSE